MNGFVRWLMSPLSEWPLESLQHKLFIGAVGAGLAWYLYKKQLPTWQIVLYSLVAAYGTSMVLSAARRYDTLQAATPTLRLPPQPVVAAPPPVLQPAIVEDEKKDEGLGDDQGIFG